MKPQCNITGVFQCSNVVSGILFLLFFAIMPIPAQAQSPGSIVIVKLEDGNMLKGRFKSMDNTNLVLISSTDAEIQIPLFSIGEIELETPEPPAKAASATEKSNVPSRSVSSDKPATSPTNKVTTQKQTKSKPLTQSTGNDKKELKTGRFGFGYGTSYGGLGVNWTTRGKVVKLSVGAGYFPASLIAAELIGEEDLLEDEFLFNVGLKINLDKNHKLYLHGQYGHFGVQAYQYTEYSQGNVSYVESEQTRLTGITVLSGLDLPIGESFGVNLAIGVSKNFTEAYYIDIDYWLAADFGFIIRF